MKHYKLFFSNNIHKEKFSEYLKKAMPFLLTTASKIKLDPFFRMLNLVCNTCVDVSNPTSSLSKSLTFSVIQCRPFLLSFKTSEILQNTSILFVIQEDIQSWVDIFERQPNETLRAFFTNHIDSNKFSEYLFMGLKLLLKSNIKIKPYPLFQMLNLFCETLEDVYSIV